MPTLDDAELQRLDALADSLEIQGLTRWFSLIATTMPSDAKQLSTRFARGLKVEQDDSRFGCGDPVFVAREFAWMDCELDGSFSPASSSFVARIVSPVAARVREPVGAS